MRYHIFKDSVQRNLLIADSQAKYLDFANFNILSLPGAKVHDVYNFIPRVGRFDIIVLFVGGNDLFQGKSPSKVSSEEVADKISDLANVLKGKADKVFVLGIPPRHNQRERTSAVNKLLSNRKEDWAFRGVEKRVYKVTHLKEDKVHLNKESIGSICFILKTKILRSAFDAELDRQGHPRIYECSGRCHCGSWKQSGRA